jgi:hypothetical protein
MTTLDVVSPKKESNEDRSAEVAAAAELVRLAKEQGLALTGPGGLLKLFTKNMLETALNEELTERLWHEKNRVDPDCTSGNVRNGTRPKTITMRRSPSEVSHFNTRVSGSGPRVREGTKKPRFPGVFSVRGGGLEPPPPFED